MMKLIKLNKRYTAILLGIIVASSCTYDFPEDSKDGLPLSGQADFTKLVSVGNSLTAGLMNGAVYTEGQMNSFPAILARQMQLVGGGEFNQPDINAENGYYGMQGDIILGRLYLKGEAPAPKIPGQAPTAYAGDKSKLNNFGVPGVTLLTALIPATGGPMGNPAYNPMYARFASNPSADGVNGSTLIGDAAAALANDGTFFTFWLGNNDVLGYATGGASNPAILTSDDDFETRFNQALNAMLNASPEAKGAVANIPYVTSVPFFSTIVYNRITLTAEQAAGVTASLANNYNAFLDGMVANTIITQAEAEKRYLTYTAGANSILIDDETLTDLDQFMAGPYAGLKPYRRARQTTSSDLVTLTAGTVLGTTVGGDPALINGVSVPLGDAYIVIPTEADEIKSKTDAFNTIIAAAVSDNAQRLVLVDINTILSQVKANGVSIKGSAFTASILPPFGGFSLDGVHPNARGAAFIANEFIKAINAKFNSSIPQTNPNDYASNELPVP